jgi:adenylate cyclase
LTSDRVERRLAAVLAADVVGSCRLIGTDEEGTLAQLKALRKTLFDPKIAQHRGRIVKNTGDGALVEFASVVDAVRCADDIQCGVAEQNTDVPQDKRIEFRIGIHLGEAREAAARVLEIDPAFTISAYIARGGLSNAKLQIEGLRKAGLPE